MPQPKAIAEQHAAHHEWIDGQRPRRQVRGRPLKRNEHRRETKQHRQRRACGAQEEAEVIVKDRAEDKRRQQNQMKREQPAQLYG